MRPSTRQLAQLVEQERANDLPLRVERRFDVDGNRCFFIELCRESITKIKISKRWGKRWTLTISYVLCCSYALNRQLCRWFELPKDELAAIHLQPTFGSYNHLFVENAPVDALCVETLPWGRDLTWQPFAVYPRLVTTHLADIQYPLIDLLFVECATGADIRSATIKLAFVFSPISCVTMQVDTAAAILLDNGNTERNALYAVPLSDELEMESETDVCAYLRRLVAWTDEVERGPCPATWHRLHCQLVEPVDGFHFYLWAFSIPPIP